MNIAQLIARLERLKRQHGNLHVRISAVAKGLDIMDEGGNILTEHTTNASARECIVDLAHGRKGKFVWILGRAD